MFGRSFMSDFENDPFFSGFDSHQRMFESMGRFNDPFMAISNGHEREQRGRRQKGDHDRRVVDPFGGIFQSMNSMMSDMQHHMADLQTRADMDGGNTHSYSSSSVMSYCNDGKSQPKYYQASSSTRRAPGNVKETRRTLRDSETGIDKMSVGHHIGSKGRVIERRRDAKAGGAIEEEKRYYEMDEGDENVFDKEWRNRTSTYNLDYGRSAPARGLGAPPARGLGAPPPRGLAAPRSQKEAARAPKKSVQIAPSAHRIQPARPHGPSKSGRTRSKY